LLQGKRWSFFCASASLDQAIIFAEAEEWLKTNTAGLLNKDGVAKHIYLFLETPQANPSALQVIGVESDLSIEQGYIVGYPGWDVDDCLTAVAIRQVQSLDSVRSLTSSELDALSRSAAQVFGRHNALHPDKKRKITNLRKAMTKRCQRFRNIVRPILGSAARGEPTNGSKDNGRERNQRPDQKEGSNERYRNTKKKRQESRKDPSAKKKRKAAQKKKGAWKRSTTFARRSWPERYVLSHMQDRPCVFLLTVVVFFSPNSNPFSIGKSLDDRRGNRCRIGASARLGTGGI
jgi:hypothetical protein